MTAPVSREHKDAWVALLEAAGLTVYQADVPETPVTPYVIVYPDQGRRTRPKFLPVSSRLTQTVQVTAVGADLDEAHWAADKASAALVDVVPAVIGRVCWPIWQETAVPAQRDDDNRTADGRPLFYAIGVYQLQTQPA